MNKREVDIVVISDVHLGTYGCHATELLNYLKSIQPKMLILNGDIVDIWQFKKSYWPEAHMKVIRKILKLAGSGVPVYYLTGNHDEMLRKFDDFEMGSLKICNKIVLDIAGEKAWFFHGDVFDVTMQYSKWLAKMGAIGYDTLILLNSFVNWCLVKMNREKMSFSKKIKAKFKDAVKFINSFEQTAAELAIDKGYHYVICGHIHQPEIRYIETEQGRVAYMNSGDWVENLTALEYAAGEWSVYRYQAKEFNNMIMEDPLDKDDLKAKLNINSLLSEMKEQLV
ncbi:MAG: hypothetical protein RI924_1142 [Bacteroidota bacterium]|jgi:UDP-2,3-diacylglucosamine pyrophosphatase LpxH